MRCLTNKGEYMNKKEKKKLTPPAGWPKDKPWTESEASEAMKAAGLGLSRSDFCDDGADLQDLKKIIKGGS
tara:strand:+ start:855 stop:1067 length:213 start_codon:yes stop_codon:yes gene_type:complete